MSHRGRGYGGSTRGGSSYRGNNSRGTWGTDSRSSRGGYGGSRGSSFATSRGGTNFTPRGSERSVGGRYWSSSGPTGSSGFESRSRYGSISSSAAAGRYSSSSRGARGGDDSYKRPYRPDTSYQSSRDPSGHRSPERKRIRSEVQGDRSPRAISSRRSHEGGNYGDYSNSNSGAHRYESSGGGTAPSGRFSSERRQFTERRTSSGGFRPPPPREDYRKSAGPPQSPRGSYRGRLTSRGLTRRDTVFTRRRIMEPTSFVSRGRAIVRSADYLRKLRLAKLRSTAARRIITPRKFRSRPLPSGDSDKEDTWDESVEKSDEKPEKSKSQENTAVVIEKPIKKSPKLNGASPIKDEPKEKDDESSDDHIRSRFSGRRFIKLTCTHCRTRRITFKEYSLHLVGNKHLAAMRKVAFKQKAILTRMRIVQRNKQRDLDKKDENPSSRKNFCLLCKLNYKQLKSVHQNSEAHKEMKRFLMPFCKVCHITFRSPMLYESHICSLEHIRTKADLDRDGIDKVQNEGEQCSGDDDGVGKLNLDNFLTLDSVGDVDDEEVNDSDKADKPKDDNAEGVQVKKEPAVNVGQEHIRKIEVLYCELCRTYLTNALHGVKEEKRIVAVKLHCRSREHLKRYVRKTEDAALRETAERIHRNNQAKTEAPQSKEKALEVKDEHETSDAEIKKNDETPAKDAVNENESQEVGSEEKEEKTKLKAEDDTGDDKLWADVDKDLGDLLREVEPGNKSSDEDEEKGEGERYDRFRYSEKGVKDGHSKENDANSKADDNNQAVNDEPEDIVKVNEDK